MQRDLYKKILRREMETVNGTSSSKNALLNIVMQLRKVGPILIRVHPSLTLRDWSAVPQVCNHPYLFEGTEDRSLDPLGDHVVTNCGKLVLLDKLLKRLKERDHRVLIFSQVSISRPGLTAPHASASSASHSARGTGV